MVRSHFEEWRNKKKTYGKTKKGCEASDLEMNHQEEEKGQELG